MENFEKLKQIVESFSSDIKNTGRFLWENAEIGRHEFKGSAFLAELYEKNGFVVERGVGGFPTCYIATFENGTDGPSLGIFSDFDALPGMALDRSGNPGHGCMHNLYTATTVGTALSLREYMLEENICGKITVFGAPAEECGGAKQYLARQGLLNGIDAFFGVHPVSIDNGVMFRKHIAILMKKYRFFGKSAHVFDTDFKGHNALLAAQYFMIGLEFFKGQKNTDSKVNAIITDGGKMTNRITDFAEVECGYRCQTRDMIEQDEIQIDIIAESAAKALQCQVEIIETGRYFNTLPNHTLANIAQHNAELVGSPQYTADEQREAVEKGFSQGFYTEIKPLPEEPVLIMGGTDEGDASWLAPWLRISLASCPPEVSGHSFDLVEYANKDYVYKGILATALVTAMTCVDLLTNPDLLAEAKTENSKQQESNPYIPAKQKFPPALLFPQTPGVTVNPDSIRIDLEQCDLFKGLSGVNFIAEMNGEIVGEARLENEKVLTIPFTTEIDSKQSGKILFFDIEVLMQETAYPYTYSYFFT